MARELLVDCSRPQTCTVGVRAGPLVNESAPDGGVIWTPDQRLRVFVSSTLGELAVARQAAQDAVTGLRLVPVMFEMGARPHPQRGRTEPTTCWVAALRLVGLACRRLAAWLR